MRSIFLKTLLIITLFFIYNCKAQTTNDYINHYNDIVPKLNSIIPNKTQFYGQNFSNFYNEIQSKNINTLGWIYDTKISPSSKYHVLKLYFFDIGMLRISSEHSFQYPRVIITFENEISTSQVQSLMEQYHAQWHPNVAQFFASMKIESIKFVGVNGYDSSDRSIK